MLLKSERVLHKNGELGYKTENTHKSLMTHNCHLVVTNDNRLVERAILSIIQFNPSSFGNVTIFLSFRRKQKYYLMFIRLT